MKSMSTVLCLGSLKCRLAYLNRLSAYPSFLRQDMMRIQLLFQLLFPEVLASGRNSQINWHAPPSHGFLKNLHHQFAWVLLQDLWSAWSITICAKSGRFLLGHAEICYPKTCRSSPAASVFWLCMVAVRTPQSMVSKSSFALLGLFQCTQV